MARTAPRRRRPAKRRRPDARPAAALRRRAARLCASPYARTLGVELVNVGLGRARLRLRHRASNRNRNGTLHGGVLASLVDLAGTAAAEAGSNGASDGASTIDLSVHFIAPAVAETVTADAMVVRRGRALSFVTVDIADDGGQAIARGLVAYHRGARGPAGGGSPRPAGHAAGAMFVPSRRSGSPFTRHLGIRVIHRAPGRVTAVLPDGVLVTGPQGRVHEGALAALADCAGGGAAWSSFDPGRRGRAATVAMHLAYDVTTAGEDVLADATTVWRSSDTLVNAITLRGRASGRVIASGSVTYRIVAADAAD